MSIRIIAPLDNSDRYVEAFYLDYLDKLRDSGVTNMFGAANYLKMEYPHLTTMEARRTLAIWMDTYAERHHQLEDA